MLSAAAEGLPATTERMLLVEPHLVSRRTLVTVIHELGLARVDEAADAHAAALSLQHAPYAALLIDLGQDTSALDLIARLRQKADTQAMFIVATTGSADMATRRRLEDLDVRLLLRPFKVRTVLELLRAMHFQPA